MMGAARAMGTVGIWVPLDLQPGYRANATMQVVARMKTGVTIDQARAEMNTLAAEVNRQLGQPTGAGLRIRRQRTVRFIVEEKHRRIIGGQIVDGGGGFVEFVRLFGIEFVIV